MKHTENRDMKKEELDKKKIASQFALNEEQ
jgi:hypothetical protein